MGGISFWSSEFRPKLLSIIKRNLSYFEIQYWLSRASTCSAQQPPSFFRHFSTSIASVHSLSGNWSTLIEWLPHIRHCTESGRWTGNTSKQIALDLSERGANHSGNVHSLLFLNSWANWTGGGCYQEGKAASLSFRKSLWCHQPVAACHHGSVFQGEAYGIFFPNVCRSEQDENYVNDTSLFGHYFSFAFLVFPSLQ